TGPADGAYTAEDGSTVTVAGGQTVDVNGDPIDPDDIADVAYIAPEVEKLAPPFDPDKPETFTHSLPISVYDSLGNAHQLTQYFVKRPPIDGKSQWDVYYRINGKPVTNPVDGATKLEFNGNGSLVSDSG